MRAPLLLASLLLSMAAVQACAPPPPPEEPSETIRIVPLAPAKAPVSKRPVRAEVAQPPEARLPEDDATLQADFDAGAAALTSAPDDQVAFKKAFLWTFAADKTARNYAGAGTLLGEVLSRHPRHPQSLRALGYVAINQGFDVERALALYRSAVDSAPDHGPSHYALAFLLGRMKPDEGRKHFERAMALGIPDARGLEARYYNSAEKTGK